MSQPPERLAGRRALVTGATGFIGSHLVRRLVELDCDVIALVRTDSDPWRIAGALDRVELVSADLTALDPTSLARRLTDLDLVFHLAPGVHRGRCDDEAAMVQANVVGTLQLLRAARAVGAARFIYCGSAFEYGYGDDIAEDAPPMPASEYGASKVAASVMAHTFARCHGLPVVTLRPFTVYGPMDAPGRLIPDVIRAALRGEAIELTGGDQARDFVYVADAVEAFLAAAIVDEAAGGTFNVATGAPVTVRDVVAAILELTASDVVPAFGRLCYRPTDAGVLSGNPERASAVLGWRATTPLRRGLESTIAWSRAVAERAA